MFLLAVTNPWGGWLSMVCSELNKVVEVDVDDVVVEDVDIEYSVDVEDVVVEVVDVEDVDVEGSVDVET